MRMSGFEPPRYHYHRLLRPARLPVSPHPLINWIRLNITDVAETCQAASQLLRTPEDVTENSAQPTAT